MKSTAIVLTVFLSLVLVGRPAFAKGTATEGQRHVQSLSSKTHIDAVTKGVPRGPLGPAPNSGDCIPDGSGMDDPANNPDAMGPAPNSGDGIPDGSGMDDPSNNPDAIGPAPNSGDGIPDGSGMDDPANNPDSMGPAPNSGDGIPDGSGMDSPR